MMEWKSGMMTISPRKHRGKKENQCNGLGLQKFFPALPGSRKAKPAFVEWSSLSHIKMAGTESPWLWTRLKTELWAFERLTWAPKEATVGKRWFVEPTTTPCVANPTLLKLGWDLKTKLDLLDWKFQFCSGRTQVNQQNKLGFNVAEI